MRYPHPWILGPVLIRLAMITASTTTKSVIDKNNKVLTNTFNKGIGKKAIIPVIGRAILTRRKIMVPLFTFPQYSCPKPGIKRLNIPATKGFFGLGVILSIIGKGNNGVLEALRRSSLPERVNSRTIAINTSSVEPTQMRNPILIDPQRRHESKRQYHEK